MAVTKHISISENLYNPLFVERERERDREHTNINGYLNYNFGNPDYRENITIP